MYVKLLILFFYLFINIRSHITSVQQIYTTNNGLKNEHIYLIILLTNLKSVCIYIYIYIHTYINNNTNNNIYLETC